MTSLLARAACLRADALELYARVRDVDDPTLAASDALMCRAMAAEHLAQGNRRLARDYIRSARLIEKTA